MIKEKEIKDIKKEITKIFCEVYPPFSGSSLTLRQEELLDKMSLYMQESLEGFAKELRKEIKKSVVG